MNGYMQLTIDGREVPHRSVLRGPVPLTDAQRAIVAVLRATGCLRSVEAGVILHAQHRGECSARTYARQIGCCPSAASDGHAAMRRLADRSLARRIARGLWEPAA